MSRWIPLLLLGACAPELTPDAAGQDTGPALVSSVDGEVTQVTIDATDEEAWVDFAFADPAVVDLSFQRYRVRLGEGVEVAWVDGVAFEALTEVPDDGWTTDTAPLEDDEDYALNPWYDYDPSNHTLSPADRVAVLTRADGSVLKLGFEGYYDQAGTPGHVAFRWAWLEGAR